MARISTYAIDGLPTVNDKVIGTDAENADVTMNYTIGDIIGLVPGGASSVQSLNTLTGALTLVGAGGNTITVSGTTITITGTSSSGGITSINTTATGPNVNLEGKGGLIVTEVGNTIFLDTASVGGLVTSLTTVGTSGASTLTGGVLNIPNYTTSGGGGTVTDVSVLVNGGVTDAIDLRVFNPTTTPRIELDFNGVAGQYINGLGVLTTSDFMTTLTTNGTSGAASYDAPTNTLNIPTIAGGVALPYFSYEAMWSSTLGVVTVTVLNNTTSRTFNWTDNLNGTITVSASATMPTGILVLLNGYGTNKDVPVQSFYGGYARNLDITIDILNNQFIQTNADIASGNFELRLYG